MSKVAYAVGGLVVGFAVGYIVTRPKPEFVTCVDNRYIVVDKTTASLPDTCVWSNSTQNDRIVWQARDQTQLAIQIPDWGGTTPPPGANPYLYPTCTNMPGVPASCESGALNTAVTSGQTTRYSLTLKTAAGDRKIYGHIIIKP